MEYQESYITAIRDEVQRLEQIAKQARNKGLDPTRDIEMHPADDVAGRVEGLVGPPGVGERIRQLSETEPAQNVAFEIAREIIHDARTDGWDVEAAAEQAIRTALAILTEGITAGPIEGIATVKIKTNTDGSRYLAVYFAGPIRAAGGTEAAQTVIVADAIRQELDLDRYKPSIEHIERYVEEVDLYNRTSHLQYHSKPEEIRMAAQNLPVEVTGEPTAEVEVTGYRDLPGVETNRLRGGAILVLNDSVLGKTHKLANLVAQLSLSGWDWLENLTPHETDEALIEQRIQPEEKYLEDMPAGRPALAYPSRKGGFRIRYGRSRNTGLSALGVHPATMVLLDNYIACGTQLKIERPGKGCIAMPVDSIHGPIVKLNNGSIIRVDTVDEANQIRDYVAKILFLGDLLIGFGEFRENNHLLVPAGYCPEWWAQEVLSAFLSASVAQREKLFESFDKNTLSLILNKPFQNFPDPWQALAISSIISAPLHPRYLYFWEDISATQLQALQKWIHQLTPKYSDSRIIALYGPLDTEIEEIVDALCIPCEVKDNEIAFKEAAPILHALFLGETQCKFTPLLDETIDVLSYLQANWVIPIHPKGTFYVGARIGRPEKAKRRKMDPPPHGIYPVGNAGGATRDIRKAEKKSSIMVETNIRLCPRCGETTFLRICPDCEIETESIRWCPTCKRQTKAQNCEECRNATNTYGQIELQLQKHMNRARKCFGERLPGRVKGVKGLVSKHKIPELLEKAILRARYNLFVYKDGTIRFDMTDAPLTHFKPCEASVSPEKLHELGYNFDRLGNTLNTNDQILELKTQDIIIPFDCAKYLYRVSQFIDDLLVQVYDLKPYYQLKTPEDLLGHLVVGLAPHTSAGVIGRIIGFTPLRVCYAHPFWHASKRRNCIIGSEEVLLLDSQNRPVIRTIGELENEDLNQYRIISIDKKGELVAKEIQELVKLPAPKKLMKIKTSTGRQIVTTPDHKMVVLNGEKLDYVETKNLQVGEKLLALAKLPSFPEKLEINLIKYYAEQPNSNKLRVHKVKTILAKAIMDSGGYVAVAKNTSLPYSGKSLWGYVNKDSVPLDAFMVLVEHLTLKINFNKLRISYRKNAASMPGIISLSNELGKLSGLYLSDGYSRTTWEPGKDNYVYQVSWAISDHSIVDDVKQYCASIFHRIPSVSKDDRSLRILTLSGRIYYDFFAKILGLGHQAHDKSAKECLSFSLEFQKGLLGGVIYGDGNIDQSVRVISVNKQLVNHLSLISLNLNLFPHLQNATRTTNFSEDPITFYDLRYYSTDLQKLSNLVLGTKGEQLKDRLEATPIRRKRQMRFGFFNVVEIKELESLSEHNEEYVYDFVIDSEIKTFIGGFGSLATYDCDGDEDSVLLALDPMINFSREYLPTSRGGTMDTPLVLSVTITPKEIDDEAHNIDGTGIYPLEFYKRTMQFVDPKDVEGIFDLVAHRVVDHRINPTAESYGLQFSHPTCDINYGPRVTTYTKLKTMQEKVERQFAIGKRIAAVDVQDMARRLLDSHFLPDIFGNTRAFSTQQFRCTSCNEKFRRIPLSGKCPVCSGKLVLTVTKAGIVKYLDLATKIAQEYDLPKYYQQRLEMASRIIDSLFPPQQDDQQTTLKRFS
jgi:DNA polymerase II large subunit